MTRPAFLARLGLGALVALGACASGAGGGAMPVPPAPGGTMQGVIEAARADLARRTGLAPGAIELLSAEAVTWPDGGLGCPRPGAVYTMALVPGWRILLRAGGQTFDYHAGGRGALVLCPQGQATDPLPGGSR